MKMAQAIMHKGQILAGTLTVTHKLSSQGGIHVFDNIWLILEISAMSGTETLDMYGHFVGATDYRTAALATQIDIKANDSDIITQDLSGLGPIHTIKLVAANIADAETIDYTLVCW
jgi:hypothetical protein